MYKTVQNKKALSHWKKQKFIDKVRTEVVVSRVVMYATQLRYTKTEDASWTVDTRFTVLLRTKQKSRGS